MSNSPRRRATPAGRYRHATTQAPGTPRHRAAAYAFAITMLATTVPTPSRALYRRRFGFSEVIVTVVFATPPMRSACRRRRRPRS